MAKKIIWSKAAKVIFDDIYDYLDYEFSENTAEKFAANVNERLRLISNYPESGRLTVKKRNVRMAKIDKYRVLYYKVKDTIIVLYLFDTRQDPRKNPYK